MRKVIFFINNLKSGGAESVFVQDANELKNRGCDIFIVLLYGSEAQSPLLKLLQIDKSNIVFLRAKNIYDVSAYKRAHNFLRTHNDAVVYATLDDAIFVARLATLGVGSRLVTREANTTEQKSFKHKLADMLLNFRVNQMVAVSEEVKKSLLIYQPWKKNKIVVLYNGVSIPSASSLERDTDTILTVGSLTPKKNQKLLLEAFGSLLADQPRLQLRIAGEGVLRDELESFVEKHGLSRNVSFLGNLSKEDLFLEYQKAAIFVLSSNQEGCPNALLEAMSWAVPSIGTRVGAVEEIIEDGLSGYVVPKKDAVRLAEWMRTLLLDEDKRATFSKQGKERIINLFSIENHIAKLENILFQ